MINVTRTIRYIGLLLALLLTGCEFNPNATPVVLNPTRISQGTGLPTFAGGPQPTQVFPTPIPGVATLPFATLRPTVIPTAVPPTAIPTLDNNWSPIVDGIQYRRLAFLNSSGQTVGMLVARIDPARTTIKVKYTAGQRKTITDWLTALPGAKVIVNASYYDTAGNPIGLAEVDGLLYGRQTSRNDAGFFQVVNNAAKVRSLYLQPYNNAERLDQVVEAFPMLMVGGQYARASNFNPDINNTPNRRTVIAQDVQGRILIIVTSYGTASLSDTALWLYVSGLQVDTALNLDGGGSTALYLATGGPSQWTPGLAAVPAVIAVYSR